MKHYINDFFTHKIYLMNEELIVRPTVIGTKLNNKCVATTYSYILLYIYDLPILNQCYTVTTLA